MTNKIKSLHIQLFRDFLFSVVRITYTLSTTIVVGLIFLSSCSTTKKINALKPESDEPTPIVYKTNPSFVSVPVVIQVKDIESIVNKNLQGLIYEDNNIEDDNLIIKIWKQAPIILENKEEGKIKTILPLRAEIKYRYGFNKLGISITDIKDIDLDGKIELLSNVGLIDWKLSTQTSLKSLDWNKIPTISIGGNPLNITFLVNQALKIFRKKIETSIDDAVRKSMDFKPRVLEAVEKLVSPVEISKEYETWLNIFPSELYATKATLKDGTIGIDLGMKCNIETKVGQLPNDKFDKTQLALKTVSSLPDKIMINVAAVSTFTDAKRILLNNFKGQEFGDGKRKVTIQNLDLWHKTGKIVIALELAGSINGTVYLVGVPKFDNATKEIYFDQLEYVLDTKNKLLKSANWLLSGIVLKKINSACRYSIQENLDEAKNQLIKYTQNYSPFEGVYINGELGDVQFQNIQITNTSTIAFINIGGKIRVKVDGLK
ncbi:MAG: DUF4403 family protein [Flavobacteriales bacterium]|nr:DUF4403 family protein [Flavobacteriales bacterium]